MKFQEELWKGSVKGFGLVLGDSNNRNSFLTLVETRKSKNTVLTGSVSHAVSLVDSQTADSCHGLSW